MTRWGVVILAIVSLAGMSIAMRPAEAGYSSGKSSISSSRSSSSSSRSSSSSFSRSSPSRSSSFSSSSSSSNRSSSSYSSGKGSSYSSGKGGSYHDSSSGSFGSSAAKAMQEQEQSSRILQTPPPLPVHSSPTPSVTYPSVSPSAGGSSEISWRDREIQYLRGQLDAQRYASRRSRQDLIYSSYYGRRVTSYSDGYSPWFWLWLMDRSADEQGTWLYHHRYAMDQARYDDLVSRNAELRSRVGQLEAQHVVRNATYVPDTLGDADLMYSDECVAKIATQSAATTLPATQEVVPEAIAVEQATPSPAPVPMPVESTTAPPADQIPAPQPQTYYPPVNNVTYSSGPDLFGGMFCVFVGAMVVALAVRISSFLGKDAPVLEYQPSTPSRYAAIPVSPRVEDENLLGMNPGQRFAIEHPEFAGRVFHVDEVLEYQNNIGGRVFSFTAYSASADDGGDGGVQVRVERGEGGGMNAVALRLHDQMPYNEGLYKIVAVDNTGLFQITDDQTGEVTAEYRRPEGLRAAFTPTVVSKWSGSRRVQYWDYWRTITDDAGNEQKECLIVEMDQNRYFRIFIGPEIDAATVRMV